MRQNRLLKFGRAKPPDQVDDSRFSRVMARQFMAYDWKNRGHLLTSVVIASWKEAVKRFSLQVYLFFERATMAALTPEANRAARAILKWSVRELAEKAGIAFSTVHRFETTGSATNATKEKIKAAYAAHGVEITNGDYTGARLLLRRDQS